MGWLRRGGKNLRCQNRRWGQPRGGRIGDHGSQVLGSGPSREGGERGEWK